MDHMTLIFVGSNSISDFVVLQLFHDYSLEICLNTL